MLKSILLPLTPISQDKTTCEVAFDLAKVFNAHLKALYIEPDPRSAVPLVGEGLSADTILDICRAAQTDISTQTDACLYHLREWANCKELTLVDDDSHKNNKTSVYFDKVNGHILNTVGRAARLCDLSVCPKPTENLDPDATDILHEVLYRSGKSALMVPEIMSGETGRHILVAWNGRTECARAITSAMAFLQNAHQVSIVTIGTLNQALPDANALKEYLARHAVEAEVLAVANGNHDIGHSLIETARNIKADMMVIGAYSHERWREIIMGGVTRTLIDQCHIPLFLSH